MKATICDHCKKPRENMYILLTETYGTARTGLDFCGYECLAQYARKKAGPKPSEGVAKIIGTLWSKL